ncbi:hypothetical protein DRP05_08905 [Archaeoglobales archaeon]|nr:MAG: hypothetical protein DRP05_08905 [Archaeoglobales archaeon]
MVKTKYDDYIKSVMILSKDLVKFYTKCLILSSIEGEESLSQIQLKTKLSFVTVQSTIKELEEDGILHTEITTTKNGKIRKIVRVSNYHKKLARKFISCLVYYHSLFEIDERNINEDKIISLKAFEK